MASVRQMIAFTPRRQGLLMGFLAGLMGIALVFAIATPSLLRSRGAEDVAATGLSAYATENRDGSVGALQRALTPSGVVGGVPGGIAASIGAADADRKIVKTAQLSLIAADPVKRRPAPSPNSSAATR
jgi:hypothetical protein